MESFRTFFIDEDGHLRKYRLKIISAVIAIEEYAHVFTLPRAKGAKANSPISKLSSNLLRDNLKGGLNYLFFFCFFGSLAWFFAIFAVFAVI